MGDQHYDVISAFIKSMRGSDPDAVLHYLARMLHAGEDPRFIARRIMIHAAEDVGLADPMALVVAQAAAKGLEMVGLPEGRLLLAEAALYIACAPKKQFSIVSRCRNGRCAEREIWSSTASFTRCQLSRCRKIRTWARVSLSS